MIPFSHILISEFGAICRNRLHHRRLASSILLFLFTAIASTATFAGEGKWSQWRGPNRDGHSDAKKLLKSWPNGGPDLKWTYTDAGVGYSSVAVVDGCLYTLGADKTDCFAICLNLSDSSLKWKTAFSRTGNAEDYNVDWGGGPRSTPTVSGTQVFVLSDIGILASLDTNTGEIQWKTDLVKDHGGKIPNWGYSDSPLVDGDRVVITPGQEKFLLAVDRTNGKEVWSSHDFSAEAQYVSILKGQTGNTDFYLSAGKKGLVAFDHQTGAQLFQNTASGNTVAVIPTPILFGDQIYHTSGYGAGNVLIELEDRGRGNVEADMVYHLTRKTMENHHGGVVLVDKTIFGFSKTNGGVWMAQDLKTGQILWEEKIRPNKSGSISYADGRLYCYSDKDGTVFLIQPSRSGWQQKGMLRIPRETNIPRGKGAIWSHPVVAEQTLIIRDQDLIHTFHIGE